MRCAALVLSLLELLVPASLRAAQAAEAQELVGKLSIVQQNWRHSGKLLIVDITLKNDNSFPVQRVWSYPVRSPAIQHVRRTAVA